MPLLAAIVGYVSSAAGLGPREPMEQFLFVLALVTLGYVGGTFYSLSYLRKVAIMERPRACLTPSVVMFGALCSLPLIFSFGKVPALGFGLFAGYFSAITLCFAFITRWGISRLASDREAPGFPVGNLKERDP
jgi:hypothetical protein